MAICGLIPNVENWTGGFKGIRFRKWRIFSKPTPPDITRVNSNVAWHATFVIFFQAPLSGYGNVNHNFLSPLIPYIRKTDVCFSLTSFKVFQISGDNNSFSMHYSSCSPTASMTTSSEIPSVADQTLSLWCSISRKIIISFWIITLQDTLMTSS